MVIEDNPLRSYAAVCRQAIDSDLAWKWFETCLARRILGEQVVQQVFGKSCFPKLGMGSNL